MAGDVADGGGSGGRYEGMSGWAAVRGVEAGLLYFLMGAFEDTSSEACMFA